MYQCNNKIDEAINKNIVVFNDRRPLSMMIASQMWWQKDYKLHLYLFDLFFNDALFKEEFIKLFSVNHREILKYLLLYKIIPLAYNYETGKKYVDRLNENIFKYLNCLSINVDNFSKIQMENIMKNDYNFVYSRHIIFDYPIVNYENYIIVFYSGLLSAVFKKACREIGKVDSNNLGKRYELIFYDLFIKYYTHKDKIEFKPNLIKGNELCDILIKKENSYIFIDLKSKAFIEDIYLSNENSKKEINIYCNFILERYKKIKLIKQKKYSYFKNENVDINSIYNLVVVNENMEMNPEIIYDFLLKKDNEIDINYCKKNIVLINHYDLLSCILRDVDIINHIEKRILEAATSNYFTHNIYGTYKEKIHCWYNKLSDESIALLKSLIDL